MAYPCQPSTSEVGSCHRSFTPLHRLQALPARSEPRSAGNELTSPTGYCGLSPPTLFERIGIMAADGQLLSTTFHAAHRRCVTRQRRARHPELARRTGSPSLGPEVRAGLPVKTTPTGIASGPAQWVGSRIGMRVSKASEDDANSHQRPDLAKRLHGRASTTGNGWRSPSRQASRPIATHHSGRQGMSARAGPFA